jgi:hypothetical protein
LARINQDLIERLKKELGVEQNAVYTRIQRVVRETGLERPMAALLLAMGEGVNVNKYSTEAQRAEVRGFLGGGHRRRDREDAEIEIVEHPPRLRPAKKARPVKRRRSKGKTVFVVHVNETSRCGNQCSNSCAR